MRLFLTPSYGTFKDMIKPLFYSVFVFLFMTGNVLAQDVVRVRTGEHEGYSRLVFDFSSRPNYTVRDDEVDTLILNFDRGAQIKAPPPSPPADNITSFKTLSNDPLSVSLSFSKGTKIRHFNAGNRVVVDVYGTGRASKSRKSKAEKTPKMAAIKPSLPEKKSVDKAQQDTKSVEIVQAVAPSDEALDDTHGGGDAEAGHADDHAEVPVVVKAPLTIVERAALKIKPVAISFSSTTAQGMAAFELNDQLWLVNDVEDLVLEPLVGGSGAKNLAELKRVRVMDGKAYKVKMPDQAKVRGQGGGLSWRVLLSSDPPKDPPTAPQRIGAVEGQARAGKVLWPFPDVGEILSVTDPVSGAEITVVTVKNAKLYAGPGYDFVDFKTLPSSVGLAVVPKVDDLEVKVTPRGVEISRPSGLAIQNSDQVAQVAEQHKKKMRDEKIVQTDERRIFDFESWNMGGIQELGPNTTLILSELRNMSEEERVEALVTLAKTYLSNAQGAEALGFLYYAESLLPALGGNPEFLALRGAANAIDRKSEDAFSDLSKKALKPFPEIGYWRAYALAGLGDWVQAKEVLPESYAALHSYSPLVFNYLALVLAEVELRSGTIAQAMSLLSALAENEDKLYGSQKAALAYLKGEAARQQGNTEKTREYWEPLVTGFDDLYRAKAGLALSRLLVMEKKLTPEETIDSLERLRYAWRGDGLEAQTYYWLGKTYFEAGEHARALNIFREAASIAAGTDLGTRVAAEMSEIFTDLFLSDKLSKVAAPEAAALYEQFSELVPIGEQGDQVVERLAEHLVQADMLERASTLLSHQLEHRLKGEESYRVGVRLAGIHLINRDPDQSMYALSLAEKSLRDLPEEFKTEARALERSLLRARALSQKDRPDQAIKILENLERLPNVNRLRADIAWNAAYWDDAADAFGDVVLDESISLTRPLNDTDTGLLLNWAVALNLASDRVGLANMREKYSDAMSQTNKARVFGVVTRPRQSVSLAARETLMGIVSEVDLFGEFLDTYRSSGAATQ